MKLFTWTGDGERREMESCADEGVLLAKLEERRWPGLDSQGRMTDRLLDQIARFDHLTALDLAGSKGIGDEGMASLPRLPNLQRLNLAWTPIRDVGVRHLADCASLTHLNLTGTPSGDGALAALAHRPRLRQFRSGQAVTDAGFEWLHHWPAFKTWQGGEERLALLSAAPEPNCLALHGEFSAAGLAQLAGLEGLFALHLVPKSGEIPAAWLEPLARLSHLAFLGAPANDDTMPRLAALPHLRFLMCQDTPAGDAGFIALSHARGLSYLWGRRCYNLGRSGFEALAGMPALAHLSVSCRNVGDAGLAALPRFPALRELMPMDVPDEGFRHIAACEALESLVLVYCRETGDAATAAIATLPRLKRYFASYNRISDRTPEMLSAMTTLEEITFEACAGLTDAGIAALARLPQLRRLRLSGIAGVSAGVAAAFPPEVDLSYTA